MAGKSLNRVQLIGNLGKDPEIKYTPQGTPVAKITLATNERFKDKAGEWQDRTEWHNIVLWQRLAEIVALVLGDFLRTVWAPRSVAAIGYLIVFGSWLGFSAFVWLLGHVPTSKV